MITIREAQQSDLDYVKQNPIEEQVKAYPDLKLKGYCKTMLWNDKIIGIGGFLVYWQGMAEAWCILSKDANEHKVPAFRAMKQFVEQAIIDLKLIRIQAIIRAEFELTRKMDEALGFHCEGLLEKYHPDGSDGIMMARIM